MVFWEQKIVLVLQIACISFGLILISIGLTSCTETKKFELPFYNTPDFSPVFISSVEERNQHISHQIGDFNCINQDGDTISGQNIKIRYILLVSCLQVVVEFVLN